jgi:hypothetical protein
MSKDTIYRQDAIDTLMVRDKELRNIDWYDKPYAENECRGIDEALAIVSNLPSAQSQPVVRCKDCKHMITHEGYGYLGEPAYTCEGNMEGWVLPDSFCSHAERRIDSDGKD